MVKTLTTETVISKPTRHIGVELLRIVSTLMVITLHTLGCTSILSANIMNEKGVVLWLFEVLSYGAVNCFAITSGYVSCKSRFKISRLLNIWLQVLFIFIVMTVAWGQVAPDLLAENAYIKMFFPVLSYKNWYVTAFVGMSLFSPFLNILIQNMSKNQYKYLLGVIFILFCITNCIPNVTDLFRLSGGYSMLWLSSMYIVGGYIRIHGVPNVNNRYLWLMGYFISSIIVWAYYIVVYRTTFNSLGTAKYHDIFLSYTSPFIVLSAICLFEFFLTINPQKGSKFICAISPLTFGIFIFHTQDLYWNMVLIKSVNAIAQKPLDEMVLGILCIVLVTFIICGIATYLITLIFKLLKVNKLCNFVENTLFKKPKKMLES